MNANLPDRRHPAALTPEEVRALEEFIGALQENLVPHLVSLTPEERRALPRMDDEKIAFMNEMFEHAKAHPDLVPDSIDMVKFERDVTTFRELSAVSKHLHELMESLEERMLQLDPVSRFDAGDALRDAMSRGAPGWPGVGERPVEGDERGDAPPDAGA